MTSKAFFRSIQKGSVSEVKKLLRERSSHIDAKDVDGKTALHFAAESGNLLITRTLISKRVSLFSNFIKNLTSILPFILSDFLLFFFINLQN